MNDSPRTVLLRLGKLLLLVGATLYAVICLAMALSQRSFIYHPTVLTSDEVDAKARDAGLQRWTNSAGAAIGFKRASSTRPAAGSVLVFYGNADSATRSAHYADDMQRIAPMDVYILEYPGYEDRPGVPTEKS
ncbi:MAG TPA: hypothetical protein VFV81_01620, partial [Verrucomicrobiae bacterium]|nr:hypothetical protein [Verrucomicrobiae bacterium]